MKRAFTVSIGLATILTQSACSSPAAPAYDWGDSGSGSDAGAGSGSSGSGGTSSGSTSSSSSSAPPQWQR